MDGALIEVSWIPRKELRGNSFAPVKAKMSAAKAIREEGESYGNDLLRSTREDIFPLRGDLIIEIDIWSFRQNDWDNLCIGYKHFTDGLANVGVLEDDSQIKRGIVTVHRGPENKTRILLRQARKGELSGS